MQIYLQQLLQQSINFVNHFKFKNYLKETLVAVLDILKLFVLTLASSLLILVSNVLSTSEEVRLLSISLRSLKQVRRDKLAVLPLWAILLLWVLPWLIIMDLLNHLLSME